VECLRGLRCVGGVFWRFWCVRVNVLKVLGVL